MGRHQPQEAPGQVGWGPQSGTPPCGTRALWKLLLLTQAGTCFPGDCGLLGLRLGSDEQKPGWPEAPTCGRPGSTLLLV